MNQLVWKTLVACGLVAALSGPAAGQSDEWLAQNRKEVDANNHKIAIQELAEAVKDIPAPAPGVEKAPVRAPAWCVGKRPGNYDTTHAMDAARRTLSGLDRHWMDALLGAAADLCDADLKEPVVQRAAAFIEQHWMNRVGQSSKDAAESIRFRVDKQAFDAGHTRLCDALKVPEEVSGAERWHMAAKRELFDCGGERISVVATAPMSTLVPWMDASGTEPDELVRLAYISFEAKATLADDNRRDKTLPFYVMDQVDYKGFQPDKALALLGAEPYNGNPYAQAIGREELGLARLRMAAIEAEVKKRTGKDAEWAELLVAAPQRGIAAWTAIAGKWKAELQRSSEFEQKAYGASRKALAGCVAPLGKDLSTVLKSLKHDTVEELKREINDNLSGGLLLKRYIVCVAAAGDPMVAMGFRKHLKEIRVTRGPRMAAYYAALDALSKIREDRAKFPVEPGDLPFDRKDYLDDLASDFLSKTKYDTIGFSDVQKGVIKTAKKGPKGLAITFNPARRQIYTEACTTTSRLIMFAHDGRPIYDRNCKPTGLKWVDESPDPIVITEDLAGGIAPGTMIVFAVVPYNNGDRTAMPLEVYADKTGKKLVNFFGIPL